MATQHDFPTFHHIHCSSRFDRSADSLNSDMDDWIDKASVITLTEINSTGRRQALQEKGWGDYNSKLNSNSDNCAISWSKDTWGEKKHGTTRLTQNTFYRLNGNVQTPVFSIGVLLQHQNSSHKLLVMATHMPAWVQGHGGQHWTHSEPFWQARKKAYQEAMKSFVLNVNATAAKHKPDAVLIAADWNLNLKLDWVRGYFTNIWGAYYQLAWEKFPTEGGSLHGVHPSPLVAPGKSSGDTIIDGSLYRGLDVKERPNLMARVASSDHRPYKEAYQFNNAPGKGFNDGKQGAWTGDIKPGDGWWGFGDYQDDELYLVYQVQPDGSLIEWEDPNLPPLPASY